MTGVNVRVLFGPGEELVSKPITSNNGFTIVQAKREDATLFRGPGQTGLWPRLPGARYPWQRRVEPSSTSKNKTICPVAYAHAYL